MVKNYFLAQLNPFVGRKNELADVSERLTSTECHLLTLTGLGGSGKTRLASEAARLIVPHFPDGAFFVGLQQITRSDLLVHAIAQALSLTLYGEDEPEVQLFNYLREKSLLLILDNFEHLLSGTALVSAILSHALGVKILVTSREALNLQEEWLYPLKGMSIPLSAYTTSLEDYEAIQLFLYHARRIQPDFVLENEHVSIIRICEMTAGLPLAIEMAASWLKGLTASQIAAEMHDNLDFLSTTTRNIEPRHRSMRAVFDQSWKLLTENERLIFARLSIFLGGFDSNAADQVAEASFSCLAILIEKSLIQMESSGRFSIHELLRQYGMEKLEDSGEKEAAYARHSQYFAQLMLQHEAALKQPQQLETIRAIESDFENIRLAWEWSARNQQVTHLHAMLNGLYLVGFLRSRYREIISIFQNTLEQPISDAPLRGRLLVRRWGYLHWLYQVNFAEVLTDIEQALTIALAQNNSFEIAFCHLMAAYSLINTDRNAEALPHLENSKALFEAIHEPYYVCWVLHRLGYVYYNLKNSDRANEYTEQSLSLARVAHNRVALVTCLYNLGSDYILKGSYKKGRHYCAEALQVATEIGHQDQVAHALSLLALSAFCDGDYCAAQDYAERSQSIIEDINSIVFEPYNLSLLILLACLHEDYAEGVRITESKKHDSTNKMGLQLMYWALAALSCGLGRSVQVRMYVQKALQLTTMEAEQGLVIWLLPCIIYALAEHEREKAVELLSWGFSNTDMGWQWACHWPLFDRLQTQLQDGVGSSVYQMHWEKGKTLTFETINTYLSSEFPDVVGTVVETPHQSLLTVRESDILRLMAAGMTNPQIAVQLVIGAGTVKTHTLNIYRKLEVANRTQAIFRAQELGLLRP